MPKNTILVTGGAGFMGSNFVRYWLERYPQDRIVVLDCLTYAGNIENLPYKEQWSDNFEFWYGNIRNQGLVNLLMKKVNIVVHFAAETHVTRSIFDNLSFFETDVMGTQTIANAVLTYKDQIKKFIHISSSEVYGTAIDLTMDEEHPLNPASPYAAAKTGADRLVYSYWCTYQIPAIILRPFNNYGPYQHLEKVIPRFIVSAILKRPLTVHGRGEASRDWIFVEDTCRAIDMIIHADNDRVLGEVFNVGTGRSISVLEIAKMILNYANLPLHLIQFVDDRPGQVVRHTANVAKIKEILDWAPKTTFEDGLLKTIEWYTQNKSWWQPQLSLMKIPILTPDGKMIWH